jgi:Phage integrase family
LSRVIGRSRALEVIASGNDYDARTAERSGWVNRALPDDELDGFVDLLARRIAGLDKVALVTVKRLLNRRAVVPAGEIAETIDALPAVIAGADPDRREAIRERAAADPLVFELRISNYRRRVFNPAARAAGLSGVTPHSLRHTAASLAIGAGANVKAVQRMLGHASAAMTLDVYSGLFEDDLDAVAARLDAGRSAGR